MWVKFTHIINLIKNKWHRNFDYFNIDETICGPDYFWLLNVYQRLLEVYNVVNDSVKHDACLQKLNSFKERVLKKEEFSSSICKIHENYSNNCTSLELLKSMIIKDIDLDGWSTKLLIFFSFFIPHL